ncbi:neuronal acetylcholine receptor subunit alpha-9-like isoform X2 [Oculina patagonica]
MHTCTKTYIAWLVVVIQGVLSCYCQEGSLTSYLLNTTRYSNKFRPVLDDNHTVEVKHSLILHRIVKVDEKHLKIDLDVRIKMQWRDMYLRWNPSNYGGIKQINIDDVDIWTPHIILYNNADFDDSDTNPFKATVTYDGNVTWVVPMTTMSSCQISVENFPLDEQMCKLTFGSWNYDITKLTINAASDHVFTQNYLANGEWELISARSEPSFMSHFCCKAMVSGVSYVLHIRRLSQFYVTNFIMPCALISVLTLLVFLMPEDTGERMAVGVTILLSLAVFFLMVEEKMPVSENLPLIGKYYCCTIIEVSLSLAAMCYMLRFVHHRPCALPVWIRKYILGYLARVVFYKTGQAKVEQEETSNIRPQSNPRDSRGDEVNDRVARKTVNKWKIPLKEKKPELPVAESRAVKILADNVKEQDKTDELQEEWALAANVLNRFFIWLFLSSVVITLIAVFAVDTTFET